MSIDEGLQYNKNNDYQNAVDSFDKAIRLNPNYADAWYNKGLSFSHLSKFHEAIMCFDQTIQIIPDHISAWYSKGESLGNLRDLDQAIICFNKVLELNPNYGSAKRKLLEEINLKIEEHYYKKEYYDVVKLCNKTLEIEPKNADAWIKGSGP